MAATTVLLAAIASVTSLVDAAAITDLAADALADVNNPRPTVVESVILVEAVGLEYPTPNAVPTITTLIEFDAGAVAKSKRTVFPVSLKTSQVTTAPVLTLETSTTTSIVPRLWVTVIDVEEPLPTVAE
jgi:hypothetical protein